MGSEIDDPQVRGLGRVLVRTQSGTRYEIDTLRMTMRRIPAPDRIAAPGAVESAELRRDGELIRIREIVRFQVGFRGEFLLEPLGHPELVDFTHRSTTVIVSIEPDPGANNP